MRRSTLSALTAALALAGLWLQVPRPRLFEERSYSQAIYDRNARLLRLTTARDGRYRLRVPLHRISPELVQATILQEDRHFRLHPGFNPISLARAALQTYLLGGRRQGGSTLSMQLARLRYGIQTRSVAGKLEQVLRALQLERHYTKDEILEAYLTFAPYGGNIEGVGAASLIYFEKEADRLSLSEALALAVLPQSPQRRSPEHGVASLRDARRALFERWVERHAEAEVKRAALELPLAARPRSELPFRAPHATGALVLRNPDTPRLVSTLDLELQTLLEDVVGHYVERRQAVGIRNAAAMLVDTTTLSVLARVGSADFFDPTIAGQVDGTRARRSPGSALKPFVYALAIDQGLIHPQTMLMDAPRSFGSFNPENFDGEFEGPMHATRALVRSRNVPAVELATRLAEPSFHEFLRRAGIAKLREASFYGLATVLGGVEVSMEELVQLYAMLANGGRLLPLRRLMVEGRDAGAPLLSPEASFLTLAMLETNPRPDRAFRGARLGNFSPVAWKTGTSHGFRDAWAVGVVGPYVLAVWVGNFDGGGNPAFSGRRAAAPLFFEIVDAIASSARELPPLYRAAAEGGELNLARIEVCSVSGRIPGPHCPHRKQSWFIPGVSPIRVCDIHRSVPIDVASGLRACPGQSSGTREQVYEFWPSDLLTLFARAGIPRRTPPPHVARCKLQARTGSGLPPQIVSPRENVRYSLRAHRVGREQIAFSAITDADARVLSWFLDEELLGRTSSREPFFWRARPGAFTVRAVDEHGRADAREIRVVVVR